MFGMLEVIHGPDKGKHYSFGKQKVAIGRGAESGVRLTDSSVSRTHCHLEWQGDKVLITDAGSATGTSINGEKIVAVKELEPGDMLAVGETQLAFHWSHDDEKPTTAWVDPEGEIATSK